MLLLLRWAAWAKERDAGIGWRRGRGIRRWGSRAVRRRGGRLLGLAGLGFGVGIAVWGCWGGGIGLEGRMFRCAMRVGRGGRRGRRGRRESRCRYGLGAFWWLVVGLGSFYYPSSPVLSFPFLFFSSFSFSKKEISAGVCIRRSFYRSERMRVSVPTEANRSEDRDWEKSEKAFMLHLRRKSHTS